MTSVSHERELHVPLTGTPARFNPFPGLRPFDVDETHLFFGRDGQSDELLRRLRENRFVAVVGTSGSGKSSLVRAGLIASLYGGLLRAAGSSWRVAIFRPGGNPIGNLASALDAPGILRGQEASDPSAAPMTEAVLRRGALGLIEMIGGARLPAHDNVLILVDQFEELFRFRRTSARPDDAAAFVKLLLESTRQREIPIYVILTMRSDFLGDCSQFRDLPEAINRGQYLIPRMTREERRLAIAGPVAVGGGEMTPRLLNRLLNDVGDDPDQLPILQHALMRTWDHWRDGHGSGALLDLDSYQAVGAMTEALSRHAEEAYAELQSERRKRIAEVVFRRLTEKGPDNREVRRPTLLRELCAVAGASEDEVIAILDVFRRPGRSFLMPPSDVVLTGDSQIDISHESLIRGWGRLCKWVDLEAESGKTYRRLAESAHRYGQRLAGLLRDPDLAVALKWWKDNAPNEAWAKLYDPAFAETAAFLEESREARDAEVAEKQRQRKRQLRRTQAFAAVLLVLLAGSSLLALYAWRLELQARRSEQRVRSTNVQLQAQKDSADAARRVADEKSQLAVEQTQLAVAHGEIAQDEAERATNAEQRAQAEARRAGEASVLAQQEALRVRVSDFKANTRIQWLAGQTDREITRSQRIFRRFSRAIAAAYLGRNDTATAEYTRILEEVPGYVAARINRCDEYINLGQPTTAIADCNLALRGNPNSFLAHLNLALGWSQLRQYDSAVVAFERAIETTRYETYTLGHSLVSPDIRRVTGRLSLSLEGMEAKTALNYGIASILAYDGGAGFEEALTRGDREPHSVDAALTALNWIWLRERHPARDSASLERASRDYGALAAAGALWQRAGHSDEARRSYRAFDAAYRRMPDPRYRQLAEWVRRQGAHPKPSEASLQLSRQVEDIRARLLQTREFDAREKRDSALAAVSLAIRLHPGNVDLLMERAQIRYTLEQTEADFDSLRADADRILALSPQLAKAHFYRAWVDWQKRPWRQTRAYRDTIRMHLRQTLTYNPAHGGARLVTYGLLVDDQPAEALRHLVAATQLSPEYIANWVYYNIARTHNDLGRHAGARANIDSAIAIGPTGLEYYDERARADSGLGRPRDAVVRALAEGYAEFADTKLRPGSRDTAIFAYGRAFGELLAADTARPSAFQSDIERITTRGVAAGFARDAIYNSAAKALGNKQRYAAALDAAEMAIATQGDSLSYYETRALVEERLGRPRVQVQLRLAASQGAVGRTRLQNGNKPGATDAHYYAVFTLLRLQLDTTSAEISTQLAAAVNALSHAVVEWQGSKQKAADLYLSLVKPDWPRADIPAPLRRAIHEVFTNEARRLAASP